MYNDYIKELNYLNQGTSSSLFKLIIGQKFHLSTGIVKRSECPTPGISVGPVD